jgi:hypothetical protein
MSEIIEHRITIDKYTKVILSIPKELDIVELKALTLKVNKLFSISEIQLGRTSITRQPQAARFEFRKRPEVVSFIAEQGNKKTPLKIMTENVNKKFDLSLTAEQVYNKIVNLRAKGEIK